MPFVPRESSIVWKYNDFRLVSIDTLREILIYKFKLNGIDFNSENIENIISDFSIYFNITYSETNFAKWFFDRGGVM